MQQADQHTEPSSEPAPSQSTDEDKVVPKAAAKDYEASYEKMATYVVPRSGKLLMEDSEYSLYSTIVFKKSLLPPGPGPILSTPPIVDLLRRRSHEFGRYLSRQGKGEVGPPPVSVPRAVAKVKAGASRRGPPAHPASQRDRAAGGRPAGGGGSRAAA